MESKSIKLISSQNTIYCADSVEWFPKNFNEYSDLLLCGTYQLLKDEPEPGRIVLSQKRAGKIILYLRCKDWSIKNVLTVDTDAVLDLKWVPLLQDVREQFFLTANSSGSVSLWTLKTKTFKETNEILLKQTVNFQKSGNFEVLALAVDFSPVDQKVASCGSDGTMSVWSISNEKYLRESFSWEAGVKEYSSANNKILHLLKRSAHLFFKKTFFDLIKTHVSKFASSCEVWTCSFDTLKPQLLYSGGEDGLLKCWDLRQKPYSTVFTLNFHSAGITSAKNNHFDEAYFATGSYDERMCLWDRRALKTPVACKKMGGGIWRLKWHPSSRWLLAAACVYNGFQIVEFNNAQEIIVKETFNNPHASLAYGIDWHSSGHALATCSFYDHLISSWSYEQ